MVRAAKPEPGRTEETGPVPSPAGTPKDEPDIHTVLVVEDNRDLLQFLVSSLGDEYNVLSAADGVEALETLAKRQVDIVVSDVMMPRMDGSELCRRIKHDSALSHIPVILLTAKAAEENVLSGLRDGADDYIPKPFNMEYLKLRIAKFIELTSQRRVRFAQMDIKPSDITVSSLDEELITKAIAITEQHMSEERFSVEELSAAIGMSRGHLYKKLMAITGRSPVEFIRLIRIKRGRSLLEQSQYNVAQIADMIGMSPTLFTKYFKEEYGTVPSQYAKESRQRNNMEGKS